MRITKVIILVLLLVKSTVGFGAITSVFGCEGSCCGETVEICDIDIESEDQEEDKNCCGDDCACAFTGAPLMLNHIVNLSQQILKADIGDQQINYQATYQYQFAYSFWQPPRIG